MSDETHRLLWDHFYDALVEGQKLAMQFLGDEAALPLTLALADARRQAEALAPPGWTPTRLGLMPLGLTPFVDS